MKLTALFARQIIDSRGNPTVEVEAMTATARVRAIVPSGASTGIYEAKELRDGGKRWRGLGVAKAVKNVNSVIAPKVIDQEFENQALFDAFLNALDKTADKSALGANAILGCSMAFSKLDAAMRGLSVYEHIALQTGNTPSLPVIYANVINGGKHSGNGLPMQEFMLVPREKHFADAVESIANTYHELKTIIAKRYGSAATSVGDEGGFAPPVKTAEESLTLLHDAAKAAGTSMKFAIDAASSEFYDEKTKLYALHKPMSADELRAYYATIVNDFGVVSLEDPFEQRAFTDFAALKKDFADRRIKCQVVGDDLTVTNPVRIQQAIDAGSANCLLLKINQIGTITEALNAAKLARSAGWNVMVSHRSGETDDAYISHLVVGLGCGQAKIGAPCRGERTAKYNELLRIAESVKKYAV